MTDLQKRVTKDAIWDLIDKYNDMPNDATIFVAGSGLLSMCIYNGRGLVERRDFTSLDEVYDYVAMLLECEPRDFTLLGSVLDYVSKLLRFS